MSKYLLDQPLETDNGRRALLCVPLTIITFFCFGFVLIQPDAIKQTRNVSSTKTSPLTRNPQAQLTSIPLADTANLPKLETQPVTLSDTAPAQTASPQQPGASASGNSLQAASTNKAPADSGKNKSIRLPKPSSNR